MTRRNIGMALAVLLASGVDLSQRALRPRAERASISPEEVKRKQTKAEKKRAKRAARNLRIAAQQPTQRAAGEA